MRAGDGAGDLVLPQGSPKRALPAGWAQQATSPAEVKILATLTRKSSGLYTVSSSLFAVVTREDRSSLFHCAVHYWLRGQRLSKASRRVNVTIFCERGTWGWAGGRRGGHQHPPCPLPRAPDPTQHVELHVLPAAALVKEGDDVKLVCEADGNPAPVFSFYKKSVRHLGSGGGSGFLEAAPGSPVPRLVPPPGARG